ncbi:hypothetical protein F2P47_13550 [Parvibaculum sedimenti]|uniref:GYF domain-containing protein n=1 Tax=Parvibaculum sedimenti TaxID=2608632 RepID=A0A6N6VIZ5_9HYPH|nr:hypothetical protein [Parvibaculum sedimenti]KAB7739238.1 hypothetical protein F2P47_13550 [Parvibaculum sedimenti]
MAGTGSHSRAEAADADAASRRWLLKYGDRIYGPYSFDAMKNYIAEGRVIAQSIIAPDGTPASAETWQSAALVPDFAIFFDGAQPEAEPAAPTPGITQTQAQQAIAQTAASDATAKREPETDVAEGRRERTSYGSAKGQVDRRRQPETANFIIIMDIKARYAGPLEQAIMSLGPAYKLAPNVWCVNTNGTAGGLLNDLSMHIGKSDTMFIVDATRDRTAWLNLGPESDAKIRRVWRRPF